MPMGSVKLSRNQFLKACLGALAALAASGCRGTAQPLPSAPTVADRTPTPSEEPVPPASPTPSSSPTPVPQPTPQSCNVVLPRTEVWDLESSSVQQTYRIYAAMPRDYKDSTLRYPVLVILDANGTFAMATQIARYMQSTGELPQFILIGVGYPTEDDKLISTLRGRDFTPTQLSQDQVIPGLMDFPVTGGAGRFLRFLRLELLPDVSARYRTEPGDLALWGHSLSGLFTLYTLLKRPELFQRYIISSPSIWWDQAVAFTYEEECASAHTDLAAHVYMASGSMEGTIPIDVGRMKQALEGRQYPSLSLQSRIFEDETHQSVVATILSRGMRSVYSEVSPG